jgi:ABC-type uncharacterized transport system substrate-binding protein
MRRRNFISLFGIAVAGWPLTAHAQQQLRKKIGVLYPGLSSSLPPRVAAFRDGLQAAGYKELDNVELVLQATGGDPTRTMPSARELAERKVDVIVAISPAAVQAARSASTTIPIIAHHSQ